MWHTTANVCHKTKNTFPPVGCDLHRMVLWCGSIQWAPTQPCSRNCSWSWQGNVCTHAGSLCLTSRRISTSSVSGWKDCNDAVHSDFMNTLVKKGKRIKKCSPGPFVFVFLALSSVLFSQARALMKRQRCLEQAGSLLWWKLPQERWEWTPSKIFMKNECWKRFPRWSPDSVLSC